MSDCLIEVTRMALYDGLGWFGTLPEPQGDVPERYHRWEDLGEFAERIVAALAPALLEKGVRLGLEAAAESVEFSVNKGTADHCVRALDPAAIARSEPLPSPPLER